jgi:hypothetical protein
MCNYSRNPTTPAAPTVLCAGTQNVAFEGGDFGFAAGNYWSSSQRSAGDAYYQNFVIGGQNYVTKGITGSTRVRPVRAF